MRLIADYPQRTGYLLKERLTDGAILRDSLERIGAGETVIDPTIVARLMSRRRTVDPLDALTERERQSSSSSLKDCPIRRSPRDCGSPIAPSSRTCRRSSQSFEIDDDDVSHRRVLAVLAYLRGAQRRALTGLSRP